MGMYVAMSNPMVSCTVLYSSLLYSCNITHILPKVMQIVCINLTFRLSFLFLLRQTILQSLFLLYIQTAVNIEFPNLIDKISSYCAYFLDLYIKKNRIL